MEELSKAYENINNYDPKGDLCEFVKRYNIMRNMNEQQLSQRYNFTPGVTERKKQTTTQQKPIEEKKTSIKNKNEEN